jgi:hypothetical protein
MIKKIKLNKMKKLNLLILTLLLVGCSSPQLNPKIENNYEKIDSIVSNSEINIVRSDSVNRENEKSVAQKVEQAVQKIKILKQEIEFAKTTTKTIYRIDTIYIETKKNFWGKEKTDVIVTSDSSVTETEVLDTIKNKSVIIKN